MWYQVHEENGQPQSEPIPRRGALCEGTSETGAVPLAISGGSSDIKVNAGEQLTVWVDLGSQAQLAGWNTSGDSQQHDECTAQAKYKLGSNDTLGSVRFRLYHRAGQ